MSEGENSKRFDLEDRTFEFAKEIRKFVRTLPRTISDIEDVKQLVRSSGSVGSNYIEANDSLSKKDFLMRVKISRKEAKESRYWLRLLFVDGKPETAVFRDKLVQESTELMNIFGAIIRKSE
jgi:four helix bundle protein